MAEKRQELLDQANKLRTGLFKIDETREKVEVMSLELEDAKKKVAEFQKQCEEYLVIIVQQKREADEQQKVGDPQWSCPLCPPIVSTHWADGGFHRSQHQGIHILLFKFSLVLCFLLNTNTVTLTFTLILFSFLGCHSQ